MREESSVVMNFLRKRCVDQTVRQVTDAWFTMVKDDRYQNDTLPYLFDLHVSSNFNGKDEIKDKVLVRTTSNYFSYDDIRSFVGKTEAEVRQFVYGSDEEEFHRAVDVLFSLDVFEDALYEAKDGYMYLDEAHPLVAHIKEVSKSFTFEEDWANLSNLISGELWTKKHERLVRNVTLTPVKKNKNRITFLLECLAAVFNRKDELIEVCSDSYIEHEDNVGTIWYLINKWTVSHDEIAAKAILTLNRILLKRNGSIDYDVLRYMTDAGYLITNMDIDNDLAILTGSLIHIDLETGKIDKLGVWLNNPNIPSWARHPYGGRR